MLAKSNHIINSQNDFFRTVTHIINSVEIQDSELRWVVGLGLGWEGRRGAEERGTEGGKGKGVMG